jgi:hypothetical protein
MRATVAACASVSPCASLGTVGAGSSHGLNGVSRAFSASVAGISRWASNANEFAGVAVSVPPRSSRSCTEKNGPQASATVSAAMAA